MLKYSERWRLRVGYGFVNRKSRTKLFPCFETLILTLALHTYGETSFPCITYEPAHPETWMLDCFPDAAEGLLATKLDLFARSLTHVVDVSWYSEFHFCGVSGVNECNASKLLQSGGAFIRVSRFQVNLGWRNRQRKCFPTTDIFGVIETTINFNDALKCSNETLKSPKGFVNGGFQPNIHNK